MYLNGPDENDAPLPRERGIAAFRKFFWFGKIPARTYLLLLLLEAGIYYLDIWSGEAVSLRPLLVVPVILAGLSRNFWTVSLFSFFSAFLHVLIFKEFLIDKNTFGSFHFLLNLGVCMLAYSLVGLLATALIMSVLEILEE